MYSIHLLTNSESGLIAEDGLNRQVLVGGQVKASGIIGSTARTTARARATGNSIGPVRVCLSANNRDRLENPAVCSGVHGRPALQRNNFSTVRHCVIALCGTGPTPLLRRRGIDRIICPGTSTTAMVPVAVRAAHERDRGVAAHEDVRASRIAQGAEPALQVLQCFAALQPFNAAMFAA